MSLSKDVQSQPGPDAVLMLEVIAFVTGHVCLVDDKSFPQDVESDTGGGGRSLHGRRAAGLCVSADPCTAGFRLRARL